MPGRLSFADPAEFALAVKFFFGRRRAAVHSASSLFARLVWRHAPPGAKLQVRMLLILQNNCRLCAKFHTDRVFFEGWKGRRQLALQRAKAGRLIFADGALNEGVLFCVSRFGGPRITF